MVPRNTVCSPVMLTSGQLMSRVSCINWTMLGILKEAIAVGNRNNVTTSTSTAPFKVVLVGRDFDQKYVKNTNEKKGLKTRKGLRTEKKQKYRKSRKSLHVTKLS